MPEIEYFSTPADVAAEAAKSAIEILSDAIHEYGSATWVLAGGTSPVLAYHRIVEHCSESLDWSKVTVIMGDERFVPIDDPDSNWGQIVPIFTNSAGTARLCTVEPDFSKDENFAALDYAAKISRLPKYRGGKPRLDLVWLGVGEDGHTLSLFPEHADFAPLQSDIVSVVHDSPKPPSTRITLTLAALSGARHALVFAVGAAKRDALRAAIEEGALPVALATATVERAGGTVRWLYDEAARP